MAHAEAAPSLSCDTIPNAQLRAMRNKCVTGTMERRRKKKRIAILGQQWASLSRAEEKGEAGAQGIQGKGPGTVTSSLEL